MAFNHIHKSWGMYEFAVSDLNRTLVRIGWPSRLIAAPQPLSSRSFSVTNPQQSVPNLGAMGVQLPVGLRELNR